MPNFKSLVSSLQNSKEMQSVFTIVEKKPMLFLYISLVYLVAVALLKWFIYLPLGSLVYLVGGVIGVYFLDIAEEFFHLSPSPFRTVIFQGLLVVVAIFVITSSGSFLASGLVLTLSLTLLLWQWGQWRVSHNLDSWYTITGAHIPVQTERWIMVVFMLLFLVETWFFIR